MKPCSPVFLVNRKFQLRCNAIIHTLETKPIHYCALFLWGYNLKYGVCCIVQVFKRTAVHCQSSMTMWPSTTAFLKLRPFLRHSSLLGLTLCLRPIFAAICLAVNTYHLGERCETYKATILAKMMWDKLGERTASTIDQFFTLKQTFFWPTSTFLTLPS